MSSSPVRNERDVLEEKEFKDDERKLPTLPLRSRPMAFFSSWLPSASASLVACSSCFTVPAAGAGVVPAAPAPAAAPAAAAARLASALLVLGGGRLARVGDEDSRMSFALLPPLLLLPVLVVAARGEVGRGSGSISEERINVDPLLSSDKDELRLLVLLPPPLLRRRKREAILWWLPPASPRACLPGTVVGREEDRASENVRVAGRLMAICDCYEMEQLQDWGQPPLRSLYPMPGLAPFLWCLCTPGACGRGGTERHKDKVAKRERRCLIRLLLGIPRSLARKAKKRSQSPTSRPQGTCRGS